MHHRGTLLMSFESYWRAFLQLLVGWLYLVMCVSCYNPYLSYYWSFYKYRWFLIMSQALHDRTLLSILYICTVWVAQITRLVFKQFNFISCIINRMLLLHSHIHRNASQCLSKLLWRHNIIMHRYTPTNYAHNLSDCTITNKVLSNHNGMWIVAITGHPCIIILPSLSSTVKL